MSLCLLGGLIVVAPEVRPEGTEPAPSLLETLWSPQQLLGTPGDPLVRKLRKIDRAPPERLLPRHILDPITPEERISIRSLRPLGGRRVIGLTFDLCERANEVTGYDNRIVNFLRSAGVPATFFVSGKWMRSHPEQTLQLMADPLFELGNHGWTHGNLAVLDPPSVAEQILWTQAQYELLREQLMARALAAHVPLGHLERIRELPVLFRPPYGRCNTDALRMLGGWGIRAIQWSVVSGDPAKGQSPRAMAATVTRNARPGAIVIFHANGRGYGTSAALPAIVAAFRREGYSFLTVSDLLKTGPLEGSTECYELRPGDNSRYDRLYGTGTGE